MIEVQAAGPLARSADTGIPLAEVLGAFSYALDITEGQPQGHCIRVCWIGSHIGRRIGLSQGERGDLFYTLLLKDLGCSSNAARVCELYLADDLALKRNFKLLGGSLIQNARFVFTKTGPKAGLRRRLGAIAHIAGNADKLIHELVATRCTRGADIARRLRFAEPVAQGIFSLDEHWDGSGKPDALKGADIPLFSRIALLAQTIDVFHTEAGPAAALAEAEARSGSWFDPVLVAAFRDIADAAFWRDLAAPGLDAKVLGLEPALSMVPADEDYLDDIAAAFGAVVDAKSPYTGGHSQRVGHYALAIAGQVGFDPDRLRWLHRGALLHDIGKLGVSNMILDKPGKLDDSEWITMRDHAAHTQAILGRISAFRDMAPIAAAHHERLDGTGYPLRLGAEEISLATRIITIADFYDALTADRPYRAAMPVAKALEIIGDTVGQAVDPACFAALREVAQ